VPRKEGREKNRRCLPVDLSPFGMENPNEVFVPIDEPHGQIEATLRRGLGAGRPASPKFQALLIISS
jgi:hypothetical protein